MTNASSERELVRDVEERLRQAGIEYLREAGLAGSRVDFIVFGPWGGPAAALDLKAVNADYPADRIRIDLLLSRTYAEYLRGIKALIVLPDRVAARFSNEHAIVSVSGLVDRLRPLLQIRTASAQAAALVQPPRTPTIFASMPLAPEYVDTFVRAIRPAARSCGLVAVQLAHDPATGDIVARIKGEIRAAKFVVADLSESRPSVLHEYGFAEAADRPVVAITSTGHGALPFNVRNNTTHSYVRGDSRPLQRYLLKAFRKEALAAGITLPAPRRRSPPSPE